MADHVTHQATEQYLESLKAKLAARTRPGNTNHAMPGYGLNVRALQAEIVRVELRLATQKAAFKDQHEKELVATAQDSPAENQG